MHRITVIAVAAGVLVVAMTAALPAPAPAQNLVRNGSFEGPTAGDVPENWSYHDFQGDGNASGEVDGRGRVGRQCLKLHSPVFPADFAAYCRPIDVEDLQTSELIFSCFFRTRQHPQAQITLATYGEDFTEREFRTTQLDSESHPLGETSRWTRYATHIRLRPGTKQLVVLLQVLGGGTVWFDGVSVRALGRELDASLEAAGIIVNMPSRRAVRCHVRNMTSRDLPVRLEVEATDEDGRTRREVTECEVGLGEATDVEALYGFDFRRGHDLRVWMVGDEPDEVYQAWRREVPGLVEAHIVEPAFRGTVLSTIPTEDVVVEGRLNATEEIARATRVSAHLVGTGAETADPETLTDQGLTGPWRLTIPAVGLLTDDYQVDVTATVDRREHTLSLPLTRAPHADVEVAYDAEHRLWMHGEPTFPLGIYRVVNEDDLGTVAGAGFNFAITPSRSLSMRYVNKARELGLHVALASPALQGLFWVNTAEKYMKHEALLGYYGIELPDTQAVTTRTLKQAYVHSTAGPYPAIAELDPHHPVLLALRPNGTMDSYAECADVVLAWSEPVPKWPVTSVADAVYRAREAVDDRKPVWAVIQATGHQWTSDMRPAPATVARPPTVAEHRAMVYLALMSGADGLTYYAWGLPSMGERPSYYLPRDAGDLWEGIQETNRQVQQLAPALLEAEPVALEMPLGSPVRISQWEHDGTRYVVAVNTSDTESAMAFDADAPASGEVSVLFEERAVIATEDGEIGDVFAPFATHVYAIEG